MIRGIKSLCSYAHEPANGLLKTTKIFKTQSVIWKMACFVVCLNEQKMVGSPQEENWLAFYWIKVPKQGLPDNFPGANQQISLGCWVVVRMGEERKRNLHMQEDPNIMQEDPYQKIFAEFLGGWVSCSDSLNFKFLTCSYIVRLFLRSRCLLKILFKL